MAKAKFESLDREDLLRQARGVFGADCTLQLFGTGGRILAEDGRKLAFDSMEELRDLVNRERMTPAAPPVELASVDPSWWHEHSLVR